MTDLSMFDAIDDSQYPPAGPGVCFAGYVDGSIGDQPDYQWLAANRPSSPILSIALNPAGDAECLDVESGAATPQSASAWYERQKARGVSRPCLYADVSNMESEVVPVITAAGVDRASVRLWTAHYGAGEHICGPKSCKQLSIDADATQWTQAAMGRNLDQSLLLPDFFGDAPPPITYAEFDMSKLPVLKQGDSDKPGEFWSVRRLQSLAQLTGSLNGLTVASGLRVDGSFGAATTTAVKAVQGLYKITQDGIAGPQTWSVLLTGDAGLMADGSTPIEVTAGPAYARLREGDVARTVSVTAGINVDLDSRDLILGVETLGGEDWRDALVKLAMTGRLAVPDRGDLWP